MAKCCTKTGCCAIVLTFTSFIGWFLLCFGGLERAHWDPVWNNMICTSGGSYKTDMSYLYPTQTAEELGFANSSDPDYQLWFQYNTRLYLWGWSGKNCTNPNDIKITVETYQNGTLYIELPQDDGSVQKLDSGESWIPPAEFVVEEGGHQRTYNTFNLSMPLIAYMQTTGLPVSVIQSLYMRTTYELTLLGIKSKKIKDKVKWCSYQADFIAGVMGETKCEDTYELAKANMHEFSWVDPSNFSTVELSAEDTESAEKGRDLACGLAMGVGAFMGLGSTLAFIWVMRSWLCPETFPEKVQLQESREDPRDVEVNNQQFSDAPTQQVTTDSHSGETEEVGEEVNPDQIEILDLEQAAEAVNSDDSDKDMDPWSV